MTLSGARATRADTQRLHTRKIIEVYKPYDQETRPCYDKAQARRIETRIIQGAGPHRRESWRVGTLWVQMASSSTSGGLNPNACCGFDAEVTVSTVWRVTVTPHATHQTMPPTPRSTAMTATLVTPRSNLNLGQDTRANRTRHASSQVSSQQLHHCSLHFFTSLHKGPTRSDGNGSGP